MVTQGSRQARIQGCLLGQAVGDALGLPFEGMRPERVQASLGSRPISHRLVFGCGLCSDDTEHACMTAQALLQAQGLPDRFARSLGWRLQFWLLGLPAGVGWGTLRALCKMWLGFPPGRAGVASAGNGPVMRAPILGAVARPGRDDLAAWIRASTRLTHRDPLAEEGTWLVAWAAQQVINRTEQHIDSIAMVDGLLQEASSEAFVSMLRVLRQALVDGVTPECFGAAMGWREGVSGYVLHTVGAVLMCWLASPHNPPQAVSACIRMGGDTDTTAAILGGLIGASGEVDGLPGPWVARLVEWPRSRAWLNDLGQRLAEAFPLDGPTRNIRPMPLFWPALLVRNLAFLLIVLSHGVIRLLYHPRPHHTHASPR